jgi:peroxiredoxin family protein
MDLLLIVRDALASSVASNLLTAIQAQAAGRRVAVLFTQEALAAAARGSFAWPRELSGQEMRLTVADRGAAAGLPLLGRGEGRQLDVKGLMTRARDAGVILYACPLWSSLLGIADRLPPGLQPLESDAALRLIQEAKRVVGAL